jgi:hypothetical protein
VNTCNPDIFEGASRLCRALASITAVSPNDILSPSPHLIDLRWPTWRLIDSSCLLAMEICTPVRIESCLPDFKNESHHSRSQKASWLGGDNHPYSSQPQRTVHLVSMRRSDGLTPRRRRRDPALSSQGRENAQGFVANLPSDVLSRPGIDPQEG